MRGYQTRSRVIYSVRRKFTKLITMLGTFPAAQMLQTGPPFQPRIHWPHSKKLCRAASGVKKQTPTRSAATRDKKPNPEPGFVRATQAEIRIRIRVYLVNAFVLLFLRRISCLHVSPSFVAGPCLHRLDPHPLPVCIAPKVKNKEYDMKQLTINDIEQQIRWAKQALHQRIQVRGHQITK